MDAFVCSEDYSNFSPLLFDAPSMFKIHPFKRLLYGGGHGVNLAMKSAKTCLLIVILDSNVTPSVFISMTHFVILPMASTFSIMVPREYSIWRAIGKDWKRFNFLVVMKRAKNSFSIMVYRVWVLIKDFWCSRLASRCLHHPGPELYSRQCQRLWDREIIFRQEEVWVGVAETPNKPSDSRTLLQTTRSSESQLHSSWWPGRRACTCQLICWGIG